MIQIANCLTNRTNTLHQQSTLSSTLWECIQPTQFTPPFVILSILLHLHGQTYPQAGNSHVTALNYRKKNPRLLRVHHGIV